MIWGMKDFKKQQNERRHENRGTTFLSILISDEIYFASNWFLLTVLNAIIILLNKNSQDLKRE